VKTWRGFLARATRRSNSSGVRLIGAPFRFTECPATSMVTSPIWSTSGTGSSVRRSRARSRAISSFDLIGVPIVMLTAKSDTVDVVLGLESGADAYIVKPFKSKELIARVRARLRRTEDPVPEILQIGDVTIDVAGHSVKRDGQPINLTPLEFDLLVALARKPRQVFTREVLLEQVWGYRHAADTRLVNVHVQRLRAKIEKDPERPEIVVTVRGVGYKAGPA